MALQTEVWIRDIQDQLYANNEFLNYATNHSSFVSNKIVHIPYSGSAPTVEVNRSVFPATIEERTDDEITYQLNEFTTNPMKIADLEDIQNSYDSRQSILGHHIAEMSDRIARQTLVDWAAPTANVIETSGTAGTDVLAPGATGNRNAITLKDVRNAAALMDRNNVPKQGRYLLMPSDLYYQLLAEDALLSWDKMGGSNLPTGVVRQIYGFNIITRSEVAIYNASNVVKAVNAATATTDNLACLGWQTSFVAKALGATKVYADTDKPEFYGSIFSAMQLHGATKMRHNGLGTVSIVQKA